MRLGDISSALDRETGAVPVWIPVESASGAASTAAFSRVSASCSGQMVWAVGAEDGGQLYARLGIYADFRLGVEWVSFPNPKSVLDLRSHIFAASFYMILITNNLTNVHIGQEREPKV